MRIIQVAEGSAHSAEGLISLTTESRYELNLVHLYKLRAVGADGGRMNTPFNELIDHLRAQRVLQVVAACTCQRICVTSTLPAGRTKVAALQETDCEIRSPLRAGLPAGLFC